MPKKPTQKNVDAAIAALDEVRSEWMRRPGVTAVDVGYKIEGGVMTDKVALRVHVERKVPVAELPESQVFNESGKKNERIGGFEVDVVEAIYGVERSATIHHVEADDDTESIELTDEAAAEMVDRRQRHRPIMAGISCGNERISAGTVGAIVFHRRTCRPMILSNWHVLAGDRSARSGERILQPGPLDGGRRTADHAASLSSMVLDSRMDAAVAAIRSGVAFDREVLGIGTIAGDESPRLGTEVIKSGRTTGITRGVIDGVSLTTTITYRSGPTQTFNNQIRIVPRAPWPAVADEISSGGDSGSVWINESNRRAVGLHFAGETNPAISQERALANPIRPIMAQFGVTFSRVLCPVVRDDLCDRFPALCEPPQRPPVLPPIGDLCRRFPELCRPQPPFGRPTFPDPRPVPRGPIGDLGRTIGSLINLPLSQLSGLSGLSGLSAQADGGCSCHDDHEVTLGDLLSMLGQD